MNKAIVAFLTLCQVAGAGNAAKLNHSDELTQKRRRMAQEQIEDRGIADASVLRALRNVERHLFVPSAYRGEAYADRPLPIGLGQTISQPYIVAYMTEQLQLKPQDKVLEIGTGSGYQAAVIAEILKPVKKSKAQIFTIEIFEELAQRARRTFKALGYDAITTRTGDGYLGWPQQAPFDKIIVTCAIDHVPAPLLKQLKEGGRMLIPVGSPFQTQYLTLIIKEKEGVRSRNLMPVLFVPLRRP